VPFRNARVRRYLKLVDGLNSGEEVFVFTPKNRFGIVGYLPVNERTGAYRLIALMNDLSYALVDSEGTEITFAPDGRFQEIKHEVVTTLTDGEYGVSLDYELFSHRPHVRAAQFSTMDESGPVLYQVLYAYTADGVLREATGVQSGTTDL